MSQNEFTSAIGREVIRIAPDGQISSIFVKNYQAAKYLYSLQEFGFKFPKPVEASGSVCVSCEG